MKRKVFKKSLAVVIALVMMVSLLSALGFSASAASGPFEFDAVESFLGTHTQNNAATGDKDLVFNVYRTPYVSDPSIMEFVNESHAYTFYLTINVPVSYDGVMFNEAEVDTAPILFHTPWSGDNGAQAPAAVNKSGLQLEWLMNGWVVVNTGMRGHSHRIVDEPDWRPGKLPGPIVDIKASLRYLHYNSDLVPGDTEKIFAIGHSSGGNGSSMPAASGNTTLYETEMAEIGGLPLSTAGVRDDVLGALPSAPVITRHQGDSALRWEQYYDKNYSESENVENLGEHSVINSMLLEDFIGYVNSLAITATVGGVPNTLLTPDNLDVYMLPFLIASADAAENTTWDRTWSGFWGNANTAGFTNRGEAERNPTSNNLRYDVFTSENITENGIFVDNYGPSATQASYGKLEDVATVFSATGLEWVQTYRSPTVTISQEYIELAEYQSNSTDPMYFMVGEGNLTAAGGAPVTIAPYWNITHGLSDVFIPPVLSFLLQAAAELTGEDVVVKYAWGVGHTDSRNTADIISWVSEVTAEPVEWVNPFADVKTGDWFYDDVKYVNVKGLMNGTADDMFSPDAPLTRGMIVTILYRLEGEPDISGTIPFDDVAAGEYYSDAVLWAAVNGIVGGYGDGKFGPNDNTTRQDLAVILMRYMDYIGFDPALNDQDIIFADAADIADYAMDAIQAFNKLDIIRGIGTNAEGQVIVNPKGHATRAEAAAMLHRFLELIK